MKQQWKAQCRCPQCHGPVDLDLGDPLLVCNFCRTRLYLAPRGPLIYLMAPSGTDGQDPDEQQFLMPFWRFRGIRYQVLGRQIRGSLLDATVPAVNWPVKQESLGIRPQLAPLSLALSGTELVKPAVSSADAMTVAETRLRLFEEGRPALERFIGETACLIYAPLSFSDQGAGGTVTPHWNRNAGSRPLEEDEATRLRTELGGRHFRSEIHFLPLLCPECGSDLPAVRAAVGLVCRHCRRGWQISGRRFTSLPYQVLRVIRTRGSCRAFPFWHLTLALDGLPLETRAELRAAVLPYQPVPASWAEQPIQLFVPAFKLNARIFIRLARQISLAAFEQVEYAESLQPGAEPEPLRLPLSEAAEAAEVVLASILRTQRNLFPLLPEVTLRISRAALFYLPFEARGRDWIEPFSGQAVPATAVQLGHRL